MQKGLTYKQKNRYLLIAIGVMLLVIWNLAVSKTFRMKSQCKEITQKLEAAKEAPLQISLLETQKRQMEKVILNSRDYDSIQQKTLTLVSDYCKQNNCILREMPAQLKYSGK